ncbi:MAG TPA: shikimate kinase [bacterium]|nr:shikimate kinase [bacterium]
MNVVLIGFMASGKTSVGRRLSQRLGYSFLDTDQFIETEMGCSIADLFAIQGEAYFRDVESRLAERLHRLQNTVISTGGGLPITPGNLERLRRAGTVVFLKASLEDIVKRLERDTRRPKAQGGDLRETVTRLLADRLPIYEQADLVVESHGKGVNRVCGEIIRHLTAVQSREDAPEPAPSRA